MLFLYFLEHIGHMKQIPLGNYTLSKLSMNSDGSPAEIFQKGKYLKQ